MASPDFLKKKNSQIFGPFALGLESGMRHSGNKKQQLL